MRFASADGPTTPQAYEPARVHSSAFRAFMRWGDPSPGPSPKERVETYLRGSIACVARRFEPHRLTGLLAVHRHARGSVYADSDLLAANAQDCKGDVVTDPERLVQSSRQDEHEASLIVLRSATSPYV